MKIVFMGTPQAAVPTLKRILDDGHDVVAVWTQPDRPSGRGKKLKASPVKEFALNKGLKVFQPEKLRTKETISVFKSHGADIAVVVAYGRILSKSYLGAFPKGCINVHFSILPEYRGAAPVNWVIVNGETETGITTMKMDRGLDTGDILLQSKTEIGSDENAIELMERLSFQGADILSETLAKIDEITPIPQKHEDASLAPIMSKDDGLVDWNLTATEISNRIRGFQPFPKSFTSYKGEKLTIWRSEVFQGDIESAKPGEIVKAVPEELLVSCGKQTILEINELQAPGKRRMNSRDFLNGINMEAKEILGN